MGAKAKAWYLLIHVEASISLSSKLIRCSMFTGVLCADSRGTPWQALDGCDSTQGGGTSSGVQVNYM